MAENKGCNIKDIQDGQAVRGIFLVRQMSRAETRAGKPYLSLTLMDRTGELAGRVWDNADALAAHCPAGAFVQVTAQAQAYKDILQLKINNLQKVEATEVDPAEFLPATPADIPALKKELRKFIKSIENAHLQSLLQALFKNGDFFDKFCRAPAAKNMHHAYLGGLLEHTMAVARLADQTCGLYPELDRSLLLSGALLHDIGKVEEFSFEVFPFDYSDQGRLVGHFVIGVEMIHDVLKTLQGFPPDLADRLKHLILSHHGRHEFGSPVLPMTSEAFVLNLLDDLDAKMNFLNRLNEQAGKAGYQWSEYQRMFERFLFIRGNEDGVEKKICSLKPTAPEPESEKVEQRQQTLWGQKSAVTE